ncbi:MAG: very short patch repair endonuclease [Burkholderiaceae bacterium]|nr:very short patch repair endonuclease [Burkholderiaceae bacterium]
MTVAPSSKALITTPSRSALMQRVGRKDTAPELLVRSYLHARGLRFRLHDKRLPGTPDLSLPKRSTVVFVNGCFWHGHDCRHGVVAARRNADYWTAKIDDNRRRDRRKRDQLRTLGWHVEVVWECECRSERALAALARRLLVR